MSLSACQQFSILVFSGADRAQFLQGQLTQDIRLLNEQKACLAGYCSPKGRVLANFLTWCTDTHIYALVKRDIAQSISKRLRMFVLRADVQIEVINQISLTFEPHTHENLSLAIEADRHRLYLSDHRILTVYLTEAPELAYHEALEQQWAKLDIQQCFPWVEARTQDRFLAQALNFDQLGGISYQKGCYTGQEVIARTHYRGQIKRGLFYAQLPALTNLQAGDDLSLDEDTVEIVNIVYEAEQMHVLYVGRLKD